MREIKFRANRKEDDKVVFGNLLNNKTIGEVGAGLESYSYSEVKAETIGQFTGLKDKNGIEIFERDIVSWNDGSKEKPSIRIAKVVWCKGQFGFEITQNSPTGEDGYIFEFGNFGYKKTELHLEVLT